MKKLLSLMLCTALLLSMCPLAALAEEANASASVVIVEAEDNAEAATQPADEETGDNTEDADNEDVTAPDEAEKDTLMLCRMKRSLRMRRKISLRKKSLFMPVMTAI